MCVCVHACPRVCACVHVSISAKHQEMLFKLCVCVGGEGGSLSPFLLSHHEVLFFYVCVRVCVCVSLSPFLQSTTKCFSKCAYVCVRACFFLLDRSQCGCRNLWGGLRSVPGHLRHPALRGARHEHPHVAHQRRKVSKRNSPQSGASKQNPNIHQYNPGLRVFVGCSLL